MKTIATILLAFIVLACSEDQDPVKDCTPLQSEMELAQITLWNFERLNNPYAHLIEGAQPTEAAVEQYTKEKEIYFKAYTQAVTNYHNCKYN